MSSDLPIIEPRSREVWISDEHKILNRAVRLFVSRDVATELYCTRAGCPDTRLRRERNESGFDLICGCKRRVFNRGA